MRSLMSGAVVVSAAVAVAPPAPTVPMDTANASSILTALRMRPPLGSQRSPRTYLGNIRNTRVSRW